MMMMMVEPCIRIRVGCSCVVSRLSEACLSRDVAFSCRLCATLQVELGSTSGVDVLYDGVLCIVNSDMFISEWELDATPTKCVSG